MEFKQTTLETCHTATGTVVVVDVLRAFSAAAFAFAGGAKDVVLVSAIEEAIALKAVTPGALIYGENYGLPVPGFDFCNSPAELLGHDFSGKRLIQRTSAGTQGVVRSVQADRLLVGSFVCAEATARYLQKLAPHTVTFVITGIIYDRDGDEDLAYADYLTARLHGQSPNPAPFLERVRRSDAGQLFANPAQLEFPAVDLDFCTQIDRFDFAMQVNKQNGLLVLQKVAAG